MALVSRVDVEAAPTREAGRPGRLSQRAMTLLAAAFLMGGILLAFEVVWFRFLLLFIHGSSLGFAIMLSVVLAGIGMGGLLGGWWLSREPEAYRLLPAVTCGSAVIAILAYALLEIGIRTLQGATAVHWHEMLMLGLILMFPVSLLSGVLFTLLGEALNREAADATRAAGLLTLANTTGAALGSLVGSFWLLPVVGIEQSTRLLAGGYAIAAGLLVLGGLRPTGRRAAVALTLSACLMVTAVGLFPSGLMERRYLVRHLQRFAARDGSHPVEIREGLTETAMLLRRDLFHEPLYFRLITNNHSMSATRIRAQRYMKLFVYLPVAVHQDLKRALLISYGVGMTAQALTETRHLEAIDVVDTSQDILEMSHQVFDDAQDDPLDDPRVSVHIEDGRYFLQTTPHRYELITGEPPPPKSAGIVNLYTREYFALIRNRLVEGGLATYWLPVSGLLEEDTKAILRAFCEVFPDCSLWGGAGRTGC